MISAKIRGALLVIMMAFGLNFLASPLPVLAECPSNPNSSANRNFFSITTWDEYLKKDPAKDYAICDFDFPNDIWLVVLALLDMLFILAFYVAGGFIIFGGFRFMTSQGNPEKIAISRKLIGDAIIGFLITILATTIISFVASRIT